MKLIRIPIENLVDIIRNQETGMSFRFLRGRFIKEDRTKIKWYVLISSGFMFPLENSRIGAFGENYLSVNDIYENQIDEGYKFSDTIKQPYSEYESSLYEVKEFIEFTQPNEHIIFNRMALSNSSLNKKSSSLPPNYLPKVGASPLLGTIKLKHDQIFYRYCWSSLDPNYDSIDGLSKNTYLTTRNDIDFVNSGYGIVGRYAMPIPAPAIHQFEYVIPKDSIIRVGTVAPMFGQAGGGVEVQLDNVPKGVIAEQLASTKLPEY